MNVREDLLTDLVTTLYKDDARIKQLETALTDCLEFIEYYSYAWNSVSAKHPATIAEEVRRLLAEE